MFNPNARVRCRIGSPRTAHHKELLRQFIPCVFVIPIDETQDQLTLPLDHQLAELEQLMVNPHVQGKLPVEDEDETPKYSVFIWPGSDNDLEQDEHFRQEPLELEDVELRRFTTYPMSDYEGSIGITMNLVVPYRSESQAGKVDKLAGEMIRMQITELQTSLNLERG